MLLTTRIQAHAFLVLSVLFITSGYFCPKKKVNWPPYVGKEVHCPNDRSKYITMYNLIEVPWGKEARAWYTVPPEVEINQSYITSAGNGVIAKTFIPAYTWLGEYEGEILVEKAGISSYAWSVLHNGEKTHFVDAGDERTSNWLRWINCATKKSEQSVKVCTCKGKILYITVKDIYPAQELYVYYGHAYAEKLGIDSSQFKEPSAIW